MTTDNDRIEIREDSAGEGYTTRAGAIEGAQRANPDVTTDRIEALP